MSAMVDPTLEENGFAFFAFDFERGRMIDRHILAGKKDVMPFDVDVRVQGKESSDQRWLYLGSKKTLPVARRFVINHLHEVANNAEARIIEISSGKIVERWHMEGVGAVAV